ncbi:hypothetical protein ACIBSV_45800 [Embleya sp. NPDC050154]|uniref:hypothetical protein n=1 Tax=Embleya sp. NPDC050154 TaxID=3363988 RepID=UPI0037B0DF35
MDLSEGLADWRDYDDALCRVGLTLGFFGPPDDLSHHSHLFKVDNPLCSALVDILRRLVEIGVVEEREGPGDTQFRWSPQGAARVEDPYHQWADDTSG